MTANVAPTPVQRFVDTSTGAALVGGLLYTYIAGTSTPQATYTDSTGGTPNANPIVLNSRGECNLWLSPTQVYKLVLKTSAGVTVWTVDNFTSSPTTPSTLQTFTQAGTGSATRNAQDKMRERVSPEDKGAAGNGSTNDYTAFVNATTVDGTVYLGGATYASSTNINFGSASVVGRKNSTITGKGVSFNPGADFYDTRCQSVKLDGTSSGGAETGLNVVKGHRALFDSWDVENYLQGAHFTNSYLTTLLNCRVMLNSFGTLVEENSNGWSAIGCSFGGVIGNKPDYGVTMRGGYSMTSFACDYEFNNSNGLVMSNYVGTGAEPRSNRSIGDYFEGNSGNDIHIGDVVPSTGNSSRACMVAWGYFQGGAGTVNGIKVEYSDSARLLWNYMPNAYSNTKIFLKDASRNTTIIPFPQGDSTIASSEISVETNATVSPQTIQWNTATLSLDGAGVGFVDIAYKVKQETLTPPIVQFYSTTDRTTVAPILLVNSVTATGFRVRCPTGGGGTASEVLKFFWRAGA